LRDYMDVLILSGPGSVGSIATGYRLDGPGIESRLGRDFPHLSRPTLGPNQPPVQWAPGLSPGVKSGRGVLLTTHPPLLLVPWSGKSTAIPLPTLWAVRPVQSLSDFTRVHFTIFYLILSDKCRLSLPNATSPLWYTSYNVTVSNCERQAHSFTGCYLNSNLTHRYLTSDNIYLRSLHVISVDKKNQLDVTFCILYLSSNSCSTCFGQPCAHHQELTTA
jgi:hypothetical protein